MSAAPAWRALPLLAALALASPDRIAQAADAPAAGAGAMTPASFADDVKLRAQDAMWMGDFETLQVLYETARHSSARSSDGDLAIQRFMHGTSRIFRVGSPDASDAYFANLDALTESWLQAHPTSDLALGLRMRALYARAWWLRGSGFANTVAPQQFARFDRLIHAELELMRGRDLASDDVMLVTYLVMAARSANVPFDAQRKLAETVLNQHPEMVSPWEELLSSALPKWGGSWRQVEKTILEAASRQPDAQSADMMYARLWVYHSFELEGGFAEASVDWSRVKRGLEATAVRYPGMGATNDLARLACLRQDRAAAEVAIRRIGDEPDLSKWGGTKEAREKFNQCRNWVRSNEPPAVAPEAPSPARPAAGLTS